MPMREEFRNKNILYAPIHNQAKHLPSVSLQYPTRTVMGLNMRSYSSAEVKGLGPKKSLIIIHGKGRREHLFLRRYPVHSC